MTGSIDSQARYTRTISRSELGSILGGLGLAALLTGSALGQTPVRFSLDWKFEGPSAPFVVAKDKGYFKNEGLDVTLDVGNGAREVIPRVASGTYDIGSGDVNSLIRFRDEDPSNDVKAVMMIYDQPPFSIIGRKSRGISADLKSLEGKKLGAPAADGAYAQWPIFKSINKIDDSKMKFENVGFAVREALLASGETDAVFGFSISSYINLLSRGVPADDLVTILMSDHGVALYGNVIMVSAKFAAQKPDAIKAFLRAYMNGLRDTLANPSAATDVVLKWNDVAKKEVELARLKMALGQLMLTPWVQTNGYGGIDRQRFSHAIDQIGQTFAFKSKPKPDDIFVDTYLPAETERKIN
jgi:NitT/TauT family transport system substrate-binding protein